MTGSRAVMRERLFAVFMFAIISFAGYSQTTEEECPANHEISCESLRTSEGFTYTVPLNIPNSGDCEYAWNQNGTCIAHSDGKKLGSVVAVTFKSLTVAACVDLQWELRCDSIQFHCTVNYRVLDPEGQDGNQNVRLPDWGTALIGIGIGIVGALIAVLFYCRKRETGQITNNRNEVV